MILEVIVLNGCNRSNGGEWLKMYRARNNMTIRDLASACGFSKAYIGVLEKGINPTTGKPVAPSVETLQKAAYTIGISLD